MGLSPASVVHFSASVRYFLSLIFMVRISYLMKFHLLLYLMCCRRELLVQSKESATSASVKLEVSGKLNLSINLKPSR